MKNNVKKLREEHHLDQIDIAVMLGKSQQSVSRIERGKRNLDSRELNILADHFNVSTDYILGRTDIKTIPEKNNVFENAIIENYTLFKPLKHLSAEQKRIITKIIAECVSLTNSNNK